MVVLLDQKEEDTEQDLEIYWKTDFRPHTQLIKTSQICSLACYTTVKATFSHLLR